MTDFSKVELLSGANIEEAHHFPLFELTGLFQRLHVADKGITVDSIVVSLQDADGKTDEELLNLIVASGYVDEESDITFIKSERTGYFYTYFNFIEHQDV